DLSNHEIIFQKGEAVTEGFQMGVYDLNTPVVGDTTFGYGLWDNDWNGEIDVQWDNTDWHHLVLTRDSNNTIRLYRDGNLNIIVVGDNTFGYGVCDNDWNGEIDVQWDNTD